ncbi:unnamed protein product [Protopolystoma xenopodis]|uniref:Uncharacterized protein n=1 Tax=Protopolystoma xenopodis TaxID=117903 RepID=A0A448XKC1_9PLAT|nr:unnamed protein product [Protopolystoma xenopodis]
MNSLVSRGKSVWARCYEIGKRVKRRNPPPNPLTFAVLLKPSFYCRHSWSLVRILMLSPSSIGGLTSHFSFYPLNKASGFHRCALGAQAGLSPAVFFSIPNIPASRSANQPVDQSRFDPHLFATFSRSAQLWRPRVHDVDDDLLPAESCCRGLFGRHGVRNVDDLARPLSSCDTQGRAEARVQVVSTSPSPPPSGVAESNGKVLGLNAHNCLISCMHHPEARLGSGEKQKKSHLPNRRAWMVKAVRGECSMQRLTEV